MAQWPTTATGQQTAPSYTTVAAYDDAGEPTTLSYPDGELATTSYTQGYFAGLSWHQGLGIGYAFGTLVGAVSYSGTGGAYGGITSATIGSVSGNALYSYTASYDTLGRAAETTIGKVGGGGSTLFDEQLSYDPDGNVAAVSTTGDGHHFRQQHDHDQLLLRRRQADRRDRQRGAVERKQHEAEALEASEQRLAQHPNSASRLSIPTTCRHGKAMEPPRSGAACSGHWLSQPSGSQCGVEGVELELLAPYRQATQEPQLRWSAQRSRVRDRVDTVFGQLVDHCAIKRLWAGYLWHLWHLSNRLPPNAAQCRLTHPLAIQFNSDLGNFPLQRARTVVS